MCLILLKSCYRCGYILYVGPYCGSVKGAWRTTGSNGSDNRACLSSKVYGLSWREMRVDESRFWVLVGVVGFSWDVVGGELWGGCD